MIFSTGAGYVYLWRSLDLPVLTLFLELDMSTSLRNVSDVSVVKCKSLIHYNAVHFELIFSDFTKTNFLDIFSKEYDIKMDPKQV
jgi:hypothetical protein